MELRYVKAFKTPLKALKGGKGDTLTNRIPPTNPILRKPKRKLNFEAKTIWTEEGMLDTVYQVLLRHAG